MFLLNLRMLRSILSTVFSRNKNNIDGRQAPIMAVLVDTRDQVKTVVSNPIKLEVSACYV